MGFLYGDTTPFPLPYDFLATLPAVIDACVALLKIDEELEELGGQEREAKAAADDAQARIVIIQQSLERAAASCGDVAQEVIEEARHALSRASFSIALSRERLLREFHDATVRLRAEIVPSLETLFCRHEVPDLSWSLEWRAATQGRPVHAVSTGQALFGLEMRVEIDAEGFEAPIRVSDLGGDVILHLPRAPRWWRRGGLAALRLGGHLITEIERSPGRDALLLRRSVRPGAPGVSITVRSDTQSSPTAQRLGCPEAHRLDGEDARAVRALWARVVAWLGGFDRRRARLASAVYGLSPAAEVRRPARLADALLVSVASLTAEIRQRSRMPGELVLKRDLRPGVREEIYVRHEALEEKLATLGAERQSYFQRLGLLSSRVLYLDAMSPTPVDWTAPPDVVKS
jgi:hypothetical protein